MPRRELITVQDRNPYGDDIDEALLNDPGRDSTFIPGYSDVRTQRELALRRGERPAPLRHRLQWARAKSFDGQRLDGKRVMHWKVNKKHEPLKYDDAIAMGYRLNENPAITKGPDGYAYLGEMILMHADARTAATNYAKVRANLDAQLDAPRQKLEDAVARFNARGVGKATAFSFTGDDPDTKSKK